MTTITIIGSGKMALALAKGLESSYAIELVARDKNKLKNISSLLKNKTKTELINNFEINNKNIILAIKPYALEEVAKKLRGKAYCIYSILAGSKIEKLKNNIKADFYIRAMPNVSAEFLNSSTALVGDIKEENNKVKEEALKIFSKIGKAIWLDKEVEIDIATAVIGSAPAFLALIAEAISDGAVNCGLTRTKARELTNSLFYSMPQLLNNYHPAIIKDNIMSPNGTTAKGLETLENEKVRSAFIKAIKESFEKTKEK